MRVHRRDDLAPGVFIDHDREIAGAGGGVIAAHEVGGPVCQPGVWLFRVVAVNADVKLGQGLVSAGVAQRSSRPPPKSLGKPNSLCILFSSTNVSENCTSALKRRLVRDYTSHEPPATVFLRGGTLVHKSTLANSLRVLYVHLSSLCNLSGPIVRYLFEKLDKC
jgi:hypothetical protein